MSDKWHEMLDHLVNKNEDKAKEAFQDIINVEKETFVAQDAIEPEVVETQVDEIAPAVMALGKVAAKAAGAAVGTTATNRVMDKLGASKDKKDKKMIKKDQDKSKEK